VNIAISGLLRPLLSLMGRTYSKDTKKAVTSDPDSGVVSIGSKASPPDMFRKFSVVGDQAALPSADLHQQMQLYRQYQQKHHAAQPGLDTDTAREQLGGRSEEQQRPWINAETLSSPRNLIHDDTRVQRVGGVQQTAAEKRQMAMEKRQTLTSAGMMRPTTAKRSTMRGSMIKTGPPARTRAQEAIIEPVEDEVVVVRIPSRRIS